MNVLVACEESQRVCIAFRQRGHNAFSCDIQECSGGHPEWHIKGDVLEILNPAPHSAYISEDCAEWIGIDFFTMDGRYHRIEGAWDLIIAHPPCTHLAVSGAAWFEKSERMVRNERVLSCFVSFYAEPNAVKWWSKIR